MYSKSLLKRIILYILGLNFLALGGAFSIVAGQGTTPINALPYVLSLAFRSHMKFWVMLVMGVYLVLQGILLREFHWTYVLQLLAALLFGTLIDLNLLLLGSSIPWAPLGIWLYLALSIVFVSLGITVYVGADLFPIPSEGLVSALAKKYPKRLPFHRAKTLLDTISVLTALVLSLVLLGSVQGVGIGTIISAMLIGQGVHLYQRLFAFIGERYSGKEPAEKENEELS